MLVRLRAALMGVATLGTAGLVVACGNGAPTPSNTTQGGGCGVGSAAASSLGAAQVKVSATDQLQFSPSSQTAHVGQVIEWSNTGTVPHTITFDDQSASCLDDSQITPGSTWQIKFTQAGTYTYKCTIHPGMNGTITVS